MSEELFNDASWLIASIMRGLIHHPSDHPGAQEVLMRISEQDLSEENFNPAPAQRQAGCRHLPEAITAGLIVSPDLCHAIASIEDELHWTHSDNYSDELLRQPGFMDNGAYAEIIGTKGFFGGDDFRLGIMLIGPDLHYVDHYHAAPELYWLLTGPIEFSRSAGEFVSVPTADLIWNDANEVHAMRTGPRPLLAVWAWTRDVGQSPLIVPQA